MINDVQWVVQSNLNSVGADLIEKACRELDIKYTPVQIIPFSDTLPDYDKSIPAIFYGSTTMMRLVRGEGGLFLNDNFTMEKYFENWSKCVLNSGAVIRTLYDAIHHSAFIPLEGDVFIRPNDDSKCFSGQIINLKVMADWLEKVQQSDSEELTMDTRVIISSPKQIEEEWRLWIIKGRIVASSMYRWKGNFIKREGCPDRIRDFAETACRIWTPHDVFCMDVCLLPEDSNPYIIECGCFNSCGFYAADVNNIVKEVTNYFKQTI